MRRVALTACCCIKNRCVAFIERKSQPTPTNCSATPRSAAAASAASAAKKDDIVKEIIAELGKMGDKNFTTAAARNAEPIQSSSVSSDITRAYCSLQLQAGPKK